MRDVLLTALILTCIWTEAKAENWSEEDYQRQAVNTILQLADWGQTLDIVKSPEFHEHNPILGLNPTRREVNIYMATAIVTHWAISNSLNSKWRKRWQLSTMAITVMYVGSNFSTGIRIDF